MVNSARAWLPRRICGSLPSPQLEHGDRAIEDDAADHTVKHNDDYRPHHATFGPRARGVESLQEQLLIFVGNRLDAVPVIADELRKYGDLGHPNGNEGGGYLIHLIVDE